MITLERDNKTLPLNGERAQYPFTTMKIGDSLLVSEFRKAESARVSAIQFVKRRGLNWKFSIQKGREGWRIYRIR